MSTSQQRGGGISHQSLRYLLAGCVAGLVLLWHNELSSDSSPSIHSPPTPASSTDAVELASPPQLLRSAGNAANNRVVLVQGHGFLMKRDLPMLKRGYSLAFPRASFVTSLSSSSKQEPDLVLCVALATCFGPNDARDPPCRACAVNRIPHLRSVLWSKKSFCESVPAWLAERVSFPCWVLPDSSLSVHSIVAGSTINGDSTTSVGKWISKPHTSGAGHGIYVIESERKLEDVLSAGKSAVIQPFLSNPLLVRGRKVDLRVYVLVTSTSPLRAYVHSRGLARFASQAYEAAADSSSKGKAQFLTNTSVNKKISKLTAAELTWSFQMLWDSVGADRARQMRQKMDRSIALVLLSVESKFARLHASTTSTSRRHYHMLGMDVIFSDRQTDEAKVIEVNGQPSFEGSDIKHDSKGTFAHYEETKLSVARDVASIVLAPALPAGFLDNNYDGLPEYAHYYSELVRESRAAAAAGVTNEFRLVYPSAAFANEEDGVAHRVLAEQDGNSGKRLELHQWLVEREAHLFHASCGGGGEGECRKSGEAGRDLVFQDLAKESAAAAAHMASDTEEDVAALIVQGEDRRRRRRRR